MARWIANPATGSPSGSPTSPRKPARARRHPARLERGHSRVSLGREGGRPHDRVLFADGLRRSSNVVLQQGAGCLRTGAPAAATCSGEAEETILTVSRVDAERRANPGYRAFLANGFNVTRALVLFFWEVALELTAAARAGPARRSPTRPARRRLPAHASGDVRDRSRPDRLRRAHGRAADGRRCTPPSRATTRWPTIRDCRADTLEALRKLDQQFGRIERARRYAPRPYELVVLSDHGQTQGATFKQRNGYGLEELVERSLEQGQVAGFAGVTSRTQWSRPRSTRQPADIRKERRTTSRTAR